MDNKINSNDVNGNKSEDYIDDKTDTIFIDDDLPHSEQSQHGEHRHSGHHHHGGHHHSHSSHRHHRSHRKKKKVKLNTKLLLALSISLLVVLAILVVVAETKSDYNPSYSNTQKEETSAGILSVEVLNENGVLVNDAVNKYLLTDLLSSANFNVIPSVFSNGEGRLDVQIPVGLKLSAHNGNALFYKIELADNDSFDNAKISYVEASDAAYEFKHLYTNTEYFYRVTVYTSKGVDSKIGAFKTADTPRILSIEGLSNVRDIGNWRTDSGRRIKQGLLVRGTEMDGAVETGYHLTNEGLIDMLDVFGIKTDFDLRAKTPTSKDALGSRVEHRYYDMVMYDEIFTKAGKEKVRMVFADLANPNNYPVYLHCTYGCDRTGTVCYLLEALLGVSRGDCLKDYGLSNLNVADIKAVENGLKAYGGTSLKEQAESYLLSCGVSEYQIESIRNIFLED